MGAKTGGFVERVGVPVVIVIWYSCSVIGNNAGKVVLPLFPYPYSLSIIQFAIGSCSVPLVLLLRGKPVAPLLKVPLRSTDRGILLGVSGICSNLFQRVAIMFISVSFTHTVKASQPLFSAVLSWVLLGQRFSRASIASLFVISAGVALSALTEFQFHPLGFLAASFSAFSMSVANTYQKRFMYKAKDLPQTPLTIHGGIGLGVGSISEDSSNSSSNEQGVNGASSSSPTTSRLEMHNERGRDTPSSTSSLSSSLGPTSTSLDKNELFFLTNVYCCVLMLPLWWFIDGRRMLLAHHNHEADHLAASANDAAVAAAAGTGIRGPPSSALVTPYVMCMVLANTAPMVLQHFVSLSILSLLSPVSHSIVNSFKRIVVISLSVLYFRNPVSSLNAFGMVCALGGVFLYQHSLQLPPSKPQAYGSSSNHSGGSSNGGGGSGGSSSSSKGPTVKRRSWLDSLTTPPASPSTSPANNRRGGGEHTANSSIALQENGLRYEGP